MPAEHRFVLADFTCPIPRGTPRLYEAGRSYPISPVLAHAATKRGLVAKTKPPYWMLPSSLTPLATVTAAEIAEAGAELEALARDAAQSLGSVFA